MELPLLPRRCKDAFTRNPLCRRASRSGWSRSEAHAGEVRKLSTLLEASQALSATLDLKEGLQRVLEILGRHHGAMRSTVVLLNEETRRGRGRGVGRRGHARQARALPPRRRHHRPGGPDRQADRRAARQPRADVPESRRRAARAAAAGADLHLGADLARRADGRRRRHRPALQGRSRLQPHGQVPRRRRLDDRAGGQGASADPAPTGSGWSTRTRTCARS